MVAEDFQVIIEEKIDNSIIERDYKLYHQSGAKVDDGNSNIKFFFGENLNYIQVGIGYLEFDIRIRKTDNTTFIVAADDTN